ncbi:hypothetical protein L1987_81811 [Smallanthus sonchifolius]|uniref:Uncharacterized protein n=1 Tax=Smallanthus sonchifolius TaxID=185202 RepID=A0ACB8YS39_9ASTR|nr:hypothetical protein L1987_81811 [Smallanthus sonchifolius]
MAVRATVVRFPLDPNTHESSGLPWGVTVTPFASKDENGNSPLYGSGGELIPRCEYCWGYYNTYCDQDQRAWSCSLCGTLNGLSSQTIARYSSSDSPPEIMSSYIDLELPSNHSIVETCKDRIASALETLRPTSSWEGTGGGRGFGLAMETLISYLGSEHGNTFALARIFAFLSGPPDYGPGQLDTRRYGEQYASRGEDAELALLPEQTPFYKDLAAVAVQAGVCIDILAVTNEYTDLASLKFLSIDSGGSLFLYPNTDDSTLPQDMYRMLSRPYAFNCVMRLRTSTDFKTGNSYGHFFPDPQYENVQHIICCDSYATYAYDFDFTNTYGFSRHTSELPMLQLAFQYTVVVPPEKNPTPGSNMTSRSKYTIKRRLRIRTIQFGVAHNFNDSVDQEVVLSILVHKVILASLSEGVREGRMLLHDWLVILSAQYNDACKNAPSEFGSSNGTLIDVTFSQCPQLQALPRLVFALLRNPLLRFHEEGIHPDYRIYLQCLFSGLEPSSLHRAIYPLLTSYATPDKLAYPRHSLSRAALMTSESPILDAFTTLIVFYSSTADPTLPYPPPHDCLLRTTINKVKQERSMTPRLMFMRGGEEDA